MIVASDIDAGIFACRFWRYGMWITVLVDDYVPCRTSGKNPGVIKALLSLPIYLADSVWGFSYVKDDNFPV